MAETMTNLRKEALNLTRATHRAIALTADTRDLREGTSVGIAEITNTMISTRGEDRGVLKAGTSATTVIRTTTEGRNTKIAETTRETIGIDVTMTEDPGKGKRNTVTQRTARRIAGTMINTISMRRTGQESMIGLPGLQGRVNTRKKTIKKRIGIKAPTDIRKRGIDTKRTTIARKATATKMIDMHPRMTDMGRSSIATPRRTATRINTGTITMTTSEEATKGSLTTRTAKNINKHISLGPVEAHMISRELLREGFQGQMIDDCQLNIHLNRQCNRLNKQIIVFSYDSVFLILFLFHIRILQQTATMLGFDNSQISEQAPQDTSRSQLQQLNNLRQMLPEPIDRLEEYLIEHTEQRQSQANEEGREMMVKISEQIHLILDLQEKLYYYRSECMRLIEENQQIKESRKQLQEALVRKQNTVAQTQRKFQEQHLKAKHLEKQIKMQEQKIRQLNRALEKGIERKQKDFSYRNTYNQQLLSKQLLIQEKIIIDLTCKNEQMIKINTFLQSELRLAQEKLINFQIQVQQKMCSILVDNVSRLKDNKAIISRNSKTCSLSNTHSNPKVYTSTKPYIEEYKTIKMQISQDEKDEPSQELRTIQKDRIIKNAEYQYDHKLQPVDSPKPQRKSNNRICSLKVRQEPQQEINRQSKKYNF